MSDHKPPIVPHVLYIAEQHHPWRLAPMERLEARYHTPTTVSLEFGTIDSTVKPQKGKQAVTKQQYHVYCLPSEAAWEKAQQQRARLQQAITMLADELRLLGSYAKRLAEAGGIKTAPNPLSRAVISAPDPDDTDETYWTARLVPHIDRDEADKVTSHTPKMLHIERNGKPWSTTHQRNHFVCPDDAAWEVIKSRRQAAQQAADDWEQLLRELGTYQAALADGRYKQPLVVPHLDMRGPAIGPTPATPAPAPPVPNWPKVASPLVYGHHRNATMGGVTHIWRPSPTPRAKQRHETLCHMVMTEAPKQVAPREKGESGPRLCPTCRQAASELVQAQGAAPSPAPVVRLLTYPEARDQLRAAGYVIGQRQNGTHYFERPGQRTQQHGLTPHDIIAEATRMAGSQAAPTKPIEQEPTVETPDTALTPIVAVPAGALSAPLQDCARRYVAARERAGASLLEMAAALAEARRLAKHGDWYIFLEATQTSEDQADRLLDIHARAIESSEYADAIRRNFLAPTTAALLARPSTPPTVVEQVLQSPTPPTTRQVEQQIREARGGGGGGGGGGNSKSRSAAGNAPARPNAPAGWVWRDSGAMRRIDDGVIVGPFAHFAATVAAAERKDQEHIQAQHTASWPDAPEGWHWRRNGGVCQLIAPDGWATANYNYPERALAEAQRRILSQPKPAEQTPDDGPKTDAGRVAGIRRYLEQQRAADQIYAKATFLAAFELARQIHDGDTWRAMVREIHEATNSGNGEPKVAPAAPAAAAPAPITVPSLEEEIAETENRDVRPPVLSLPSPADRGAYHAALEQTAIEAHEHILSAIRHDNRTAALAAALDLVTHLTAEACFIIPMSRADRATLLQDIGFALASRRAIPDSVWTFLQHIHHQAQPDEPAAASVPASSVGTDDGTPAAAWPALRPIQESLNDLEIKLTSFGPFTPQQIGDWQLLLDELDCDLTALSGDEEVDDTAWEETSMRIGQLERRLTSLQEVEVGT